LISIVPIVRDVCRAKNKKKIGALARWRIGWLAHWRVGALGGWHVGLPAFWPPNCRFKLLNLNFGLKDCTSNNLQTLKPFKTIWNNLKQKKQ
jgi:hypothetical protein